MSGTIEDEVLSSGWTIDGLHECVRLIQKGAKMGKLVDDKGAIPKALLTRTDDKRRWELRDNKRYSPWTYRPLVGLVCQTEQVAQAPEIAAAQQEKRDRCVALEKSRLAVMEQLIAELQQETVTNETTSELPSPTPNEEQVAALHAQFEDLTAELEALQGIFMTSWVEQRLLAAQEVVGDLTHGVTQPFPHLALPCQWSMFSVEAAYHHLWQLREARDLLMTQQRIKEERLRKLVFTSLGLERVYVSENYDEAGQEAAAEALFKILVKLHGAGGKACVPDNYQAYHVLYAQMFGPDKAAALLHSPLTAEEVASASLQDEELMELYASSVTNGLGIDEQPPPPESLEAKQQLHLRRLESPWGRLYASELKDLQHATRVLRQPMPEPEAHERALSTRLEEVKQLLDSLEKELEHTIPATANTQGVRLQQWMRRMRGSLGARLRKLSERLQRRPRVAKEDAETMEPSPVEQLQERVREAQEALGRSRHLLRSCDMVIDYERQLREALAARGQLGQALQPLALQALDLQADVSSLQHSGVRGQSRELVDTLLRLCYVDNREFNDLTFTDTDQCRRQVQQGFNRGFKLRRKGHPDRLALCGGPSLTAQERGQLSELCAGMENAKVWLNRHIDTYTRN